MNVWSFRLMSSLRNLINQKRINSYLGLCQLFFCNRYHVGFFELLQLLVELVRIPPESR